MKDNKMGMLDSLKEGNRALRVLSDLVATINQYNDTDMLDGYMDDLADQYNEDLLLLGLPHIAKVGVDESPGTFLYTSDYLQSLDRGELLSLMEEHGYEERYSDLTEGELRIQLGNIIGGE